MTAGFVTRMIAVTPGSSLAYNDGEWLDTLVVVEHGEIELEWLSGSRRRFGTGELLWLAGLTLRAIHNRGTEPVVLLAVTRSSAS